MYGIIIQMITNTLITPSSRQMRYFAIAKRAASKSTFVRGGDGTKIAKISIGATIVDGNYTVSSGFNKRKTHPFQDARNKKNCDFVRVPNIHAEIDALIASKFHDVGGCEIFVYREYVDGTLANCRPCEACMDAIKNSGIKHLYYTTENGYHYERIGRG